MESKLLKKKLKLKRVEKVFQTPFIIVSLVDFKGFSNDILKSCRISSAFFTRFLQIKFPYLLFLACNNCSLFFFNSFLSIPGVLDSKKFFEIIQRFFSRDKKVFLGVFIFDNILSSKTFGFLMDSMCYNFSVNIKIYFFRYLSKKISFFFNCICKN